MKKDFRTLSKSILEKIKNAEKILLSLHRGPDGDSIGANSAFFEILGQLGKHPTLLSPDPLPENFKFVPHSDKVIAQDIFDFGFEKFDLLVLLDSSSWEMITNKTVLPPLPPKEKTIVIDHHATNKEMGGTNLVVPSISSACGLVFLLVKAWQVKFNKELSQSLLTGMATDTGIFQYPNTSPVTLRNAAYLMENGASLDVIVFNVLRRNSPLNLKLTGKILNNLCLDKEYNFAYSTLSFKEIQEVTKGEKAPPAREFSANLFMQTIEGTEFGFVITEEEKDLSYFSIRSRRGFDVSRIAVELGGGGHKAAAGAKIPKPLDKALPLVLRVVRKYAKEK